MIDDLLIHYNRELADLRRLSAEFAQAHPKIAGRLRLAADAVEDPHVSRLLEGVALLNARTRQKLDDELPELTDSFLEQLFPHYLAPIPSMAVVQFECKKDLPGYFTLPAGTEIETEPVGGETCRYRTAGLAQLWPVAVEAATLGGRPLVAPANPRAGGAVAVLRLTLRCQGPDQTFTKLGVDTLRFFLRGPASLTFALYQLIHNNTVSVAVADSAGDAAPVILDPGAVRQVGFDRNDAVIPYPRRAAPGYRLLTEFFAFPERFLFFEVAGLSAKTLFQAGAKMEIFLYLNRSSAELERGTGTESFALNCVPVVNVFSQRAEPIRLTQTQTEYRIVPDVRRPQALEIHSVDAVSASSPEGEMQTYLPLYAVRHAGVLRGDLRFWHMVRRPTSGPDAAHECYLSLVDLDLDTELPANWVVLVETTCTNRNLPSRLPFGGGHPYLALVKPINQIAAIAAVTAPSPPLRLPNRRQGTWRLISHLLLNHLSIAGEAAGAEALKEILRLYDFRDSAETRALIDGILSIGASQRTARAPDASAGALCRGTEILLTIEDRGLDDAGLFVLLSVLERFLALQATINSFTRLSVQVKGRSGYLRRWPPRAGDAPLL